MTGRGKGGDLRLCEGEEGDRGSEGQREEHGDWEGK